MGKKTSKNKIKHHPKVKGFYKSIRTRRRTRDLDQIQDDIAKISENPELAKRPIDLELPGLGQCYCVQCAKHFVDQHTLDEHTKSKVHKRRLKELSVPAYTLAEAEAAAGMAPAAKR